jgi:hypothetical protein
MDCRPWPTQLCRVPFEQCVFHGPLLFILRAWSPGTARFFGLDIRLDMAGGYATEVFFFVGLSLLSW